MRFWLLERSNVNYEKAKRKKQKKKTTSKNYIAKTATSSNRVPRGPPSSFVPQWHTSSFVPQWHTSSFVLQWHRPQQSQPNRNDLKIFLTSLFSSTSRLNLTMLNQQCLIGNFNLVKQEHSQRGNNTVHQPDAKHAATIVQRSSHKYIFRERAQCEREIRK